MLFLYVSFLVLAHSSKDVQAARKSGDDIADIHEDLDVDRSSGAPLQEVVLEPGPQRGQRFQTFLAQHGKALLAVRDNHPFLIAIMAVSLLIVYSWWHVRSGLAGEAERCHLQSLAKVGNNEVQNKSINGKIQAAPIGDFGIPDGCNERPQTRKRLLSILDAAVVANLDNWWGIGSEFPDKRMNKAMPGYVLSSEVVNVTVCRSDELHRNNELVALNEIRTPGCKYLIWQIKVGKVCLASLHEVVNVANFEHVMRAGGGDLMMDSLKLIITPINLKIGVPFKGPENADTMGVFFGKENVSFKYDNDVGTICVDLYSAWMLKMLLSSFALKEGRIADFSLISWRDTTVLATYRLAVTKELIDRLSQT